MQAILKGNANRSGFKPRHIPVVGIHKDEMIFRWMVMASVLFAMLQIMLAEEVSTYQGSCDASGVVNVGEKYFAAGTDERNTVQVFEVGKSPAIASLSLDMFLKTKWDGKDQQYKECDIEGATRIGDITLWITSHGRNSKGNEKPERHRLFALQINAQNTSVSLKPYGQPYASLLEDLAATEALQQWKLKDAASKKPQEPGGLNIEAICATPANGIWVGFRNPVRNGKALLVEITNPLDLVKTEGLHAKVGQVQELDLGGRGFRDLVRTKDGYLILAGAFDDERKFALYRWAGGGEAPVMLSVDLNATGLAPEGVVFIGGDYSKILILSDDDSLLFDNVPNNKLPDEKRTFRGKFISLEE